MQKIAESGKQRIAQVKAQDKKRSINRAARRLFARQGYAKTLMKDIAEEAGVTKTLVQYHYPHKDVFITDLVEDMLDSTNGYLANNGMLKEGYYENLLMVGAAHFAYLLESEKMRNLTPDIVGDRAVTGKIIDLDIEWARAYMGHGEEGEWADGIAIIMGGAYDLIYRSICSGRALSPRALIERCVRFLMLDQNRPAAEIEHVLAGYALSDAQLETMLAYLDGELFDR